LSSKVWSPLSAGTSILTKENPNPHIHFIYNAILFRLTCVLLNPLQYKLVLLCNVTTNLASSASTGAARPDRSRTTINRASVHGLESISCPLLIPVLRQLIYSGRYSKDVKVNAIGYYSERYSKDVKVNAIGY